MEYRNLGRSGMQISVVSLGTMLFGDQTDEATATALVERAIDAGINSVDTANIYGRGRSEEILGQALVHTKKRQRLVLATKVHVRMDDDDPNAAGNHRRHIIEQCHASLRRLQTDYLDVYYIHRPSTQIPIDETLPWSSNDDYALTREELLWRAGDVFNGIVEGTLHVEVVASFSLSDAARAHELLEGRGVTGKLLLLP